MLQCDVHRTSTGDLVARGPERYTFAMVLARVLVGVVAALICLAGVAWYAVSLFAEGPRNTAPEETANAASPPKLHPAYARRQHKRSAVLGTAAVFGGLALIPEVVQSIRSGVPI